MEKGNRGKGGNGKRGKRGKRGKGDIYASARTFTRARGVADMPGRRAAARGGLARGGVKRRVGQDA